MNNLVTTWSPKLPYELALGLDPLDDILDRFELTEEEFANLERHPAFHREYLQFAKDIRERGISFGMKAAMQAEAYLENIDRIMRDPETSAATKVSIFQTLARLGNLEPEKKSAQADQAMPQVNIQINLGG